MTRRVRFQIVVTRPGIDDAPSVPAGAQFETSSSKRHQKAQSGSGSRYARVSLEGGMTAIYGFISSAQRKAVLATDDKLVGDPGRVEKLVRVDDRFVLAGYGQDTPVQASRMIAWHRAHTRTGNFGTKEQLLGALVETLKAYTEPLCGSLRESLGDGPTGEERRRLIAEQDASCILLDCQEMRMFHVNLGKPLPVGNINDPPLVRELEQDSLRCFSGAVPPEHVNGALLAQFLRDPEPDLRAWMLRSHNTYPEAVGGLGAWMRVDGGNVQLQSAFASPAEALSQPLRPDFDFIIASVRYDRLRGNPQRPSLSMKWSNLVAHIRTWL